MSTKATKLKDGDMVRIVKAPKEAPYLKDMVVEVVATGPLCLKTPGGFTYLEKSAVKLEGGTNDLQRDTRKNS